MVIIFFSRYTTPTVSHVLLHDAIKNCVTVRQTLDQSLNGTKLGDDLYPYAWENCSVSVYRNPDEFYASLDIASTHRICDSKYFKDYLKHHGVLSCQGSWYIPANNSNKKYAMFHPKGCSFGSLSDNIKIDRISF